MINREELREKYAGTEKDFTGQRFGVDYADYMFQKGIYTKADFSDTVLDGVAFMDSDLSFVDFSRCRIYECVFAKNCYLEGADFNSAVFNQVTFKNCNLSHAIFAYATLSEFNFINCDLSYVDLSRATEFNIDYTCKDVTFDETIMPDGSIRTDKS